MDKEPFNKLFDYFNEKQWIAQVREDFHWIVNLAESLGPHCILEIGVENGGSLKFWECLLRPGDLLIGVDIRADTPDIIKWDWRKSSVRIEVIVGDSTDPLIVEKVKMVLNRQVDFLHIDGCHGYPPNTAGVPKFRPCLDNFPKKDFENYSPFVRSGGIVLVADLGEPCCQDLWTSLAGHKQLSVLGGHGAWFKP